jgi:serine/threonine protein kinase
MSTSVTPDPSDHDRVRELFDRGSELPTEQWEPFLRRECPDDPALRAEALRILRGAQQASTEQFLERPMAPPPAADPPRIGKYQIVRRFSELGGQATAYLAHDPDTDRQVVLKRYHLGDTPDDQHALFQEGRALARFHSAYVARCFGIERLGDEPFLVVEYIPGRNLDEIRRDGPLDPKRIVQLMSQLAEGVAAVHACGLSRPLTEQQNPVGIGEECRFFPEFSGRNPYF